jgi:DNA-binding Lrp family transcriptional regulator
MATPKKRTRPQAPVALQGPRDEIDRALLSLLQTDARQSAADLARQLGVARTTVLARLSRLERDRVILGYTVRLGQDAQDASLQAFVHISVQPRGGRSVEQRLQRMPEVRQLCTVSGEFDYVAQLHAPSALRLDGLIDEIGTLEGVIRTQTSVVLARRIDRLG